MSPSLWLMLGHLILISSDNILVMFPLSLFGFHSTWGAFTYPLLFVLTDLTTRVLGPRVARRVVTLTIVPGLLLSYGLSVCLMETSSAFIPLRIAIASLSAYAVGQWFDITVFQGFRQKGGWWLAPSLSVTAASIIDTYIFFFMAFYHSPDPVLSEHWVEIAGVDLVIKWIINFSAVIPLYGMGLMTFTQRMKKQLTPY